MNFSGNIIPWIRAHLILMTACLSVVILMFASGLPVQAQNFIPQPSNLPNVSLPTPLTPSFFPVVPMDINGRVANSLRPASDLGTSAPTGVGQAGIPTMNVQGDLSSRRDRQRAEIEADVREMSSHRPGDAWLEKTVYYRDAVGELLKMNPDSFSVTRAVFLVENAYMDNTQSYEAFCQALQTRVDLVRQILKRNGLNGHNNIGLNYGIQQLFRRQNLYTNPHTGQSILIPPIHYDFDDIMGAKDYTKLFVCKALARGSGQCHSMPLLYLMLAEQLGAKAWLSLAPQHSYIQFCDDRGAMFSFETTNGNLVSNTWMMESGFVTTEALKHDIYLDTLSQRQLYAQVLADMLGGYLNKFGSYDGLAEDLKNRILRINPENLTALIVDANLKTAIFRQKVEAAGRPKEQDLPRYPDVFKAWQEMNAAYRRIDDLGYQDMPKEAYQRWLASIEQEKKKQASQKMKEQMQMEVQRLKNVKSTIKKPVRE
jgi:hypothetical protein